MRGVLITNPAATTSAGWSRDVAIRALSAELDLTVAQTSYRGHAVEIARQARIDGVELVVTLGGDGTVNEAVNGLLSVEVEPCPLFGAIPAGLANVFPRSLGSSPDALTATSELIDALHNNRTRTLGLGRLNHRWFCFGAGIGLDASVIEAVEASRARGSKASSGMYVLEVLRAVRDLLDTAPQMRVHAEFQDGSARDIEGAYMVTFQNTKPWSYAGALPVEIAARASYDKGMDSVALMTATPAGVAAFFAEGAAGLSAARRSSCIVLEDCRRLLVSAEVALPVQVDGDSIGRSDLVEIVHVPDALRVLSPAAI